MNKVYTPFKLDSGLFLPIQLYLSESDVEANTPVGCAMMEGSYDHLAVQVDTKNSVVVERTIPPSNSNTREWAFDGVSKKWTPKPSTPIRALRTRKIRDKLLSDSDVAVTRASERRQAVSKEWEDYRQALRDLPSRPDFPDVVDWPTKPGSM